MSTTTMTTPLMSSCCALHRRVVVGTPPKRRRSRGGLVEVGLLFRLVFLFALLALLLLQVVGHHPHPSGSSGFLGHWLFHLAAGSAPILPVVQAFSQPHGSAVRTKNSQHQHLPSDERPNRRKKAFSYFSSRISSSSALFQSSRSSTSSSSSTTTTTSTSVEDARGAALYMDEVTVYRGSTCILEQIAWRVEPGQAWALLGANGVGKSTLLQTITGELDYEQGTIVLGGGGSGSKSKKKDSTTALGYLRQTAVAGSSRSVFEEACAGMTALNEAEQALQRAQISNDWEAIERATADFDALDGFQRNATVATVLKGLGFAVPQQLETPCSALSGGWQMRVALARQLLSAPTTLALLDEPGNHLDAAAKQWLARYLAEYSNANKNSNRKGSGGGALILVTHDVTLLRSVQHIAELVPNNKSGTGSRLQIYKSCNYQQYLQLKEERAVAAIAEYERNLQQAAKLQAFVDRFGASATKASAAQSRVKQLEKMRKQGLLDAPPAAVTQQAFRPTVPLPKPPPAVGNVLLRLSNANLGYNHDQQPLVSNVDLEIVPGMKLLIRGPNGSGKSTTLHSLRGSLPLLTGERYVCDDLRLGVFTQDLAQELDPQQRAVDLVTAYARGSNGGNIHISDQDARDCLGRLGLSGERSLRRLSELSGGEKARVALAMFALKPSHVYLLDEPSNHLDAQCVEALAEALAEWNGGGGSKHFGGALVVVSHDHAFGQKIPFTHVATVMDGKLTMEQRSTRPSDWVVDQLGMDATTRSEADANTQRSGSDNHHSTVGAGSNSANTNTADDAKRRKQAFNAPRRIVKLEQLIEEAETQMTGIDAEMLANGSDVSKLVGLTKERNALERKVEKYMKEWSELEELLAQVAAN